MIYVVTVLGYLGLLVFIALRRARNVSTQDDFMVAGRSVPWQILVGTLICTWIGSGSLFGGAGRAFREGFSALWMSAGAWVGIVVVFFLAAKVRRIAEYTVPDLLERRYHPAARLLGTTAIAIAYLTIAGYQFVGGGRLLAILFPGLDPDAGMTIVAVLVTVFAVSAGMLSVISLDLVNGIIIIVSILIAAPLAFTGAGGVEGLTSVLPETHFTATGRLGLSAAIGLFLPTMLLLLGESGMYQKFYAARSGAAAPEGGARDDRGGDPDRGPDRRHRGLRRRGYLGRSRLPDRGGIRRPGHRDGAPRIRPAPAPGVRGMPPAGRRGGHHLLHRHHVSCWSPPPGWRGTSTSASSVRTPTPGR